jgi:hypothetical protein
MITEGTEHNVHSVSHPKGILHIVYEIRSRGKHLNCRKGKKQEEGEKCKMRSFMILRQLHRAVKSIMMRRKGHVEGVAEITNA